MSKEKIELRKEVIEFMKDQGHEFKLNLDGSPIPYGVVNHLIASFHEHKLNQGKTSPVDSDCECEWCGTKKENPNGLCVSCGRFPSPSSFRQR